MKQMGLRIFTLLMAVVLSFGGGLTVWAEPDVMPIAENDEESAETVSDVGVEDGSLALNCRSAILMEATTGAVLYRQNADEALPPASVTKIMTLLLVMEAIDAGIVHLDSTVTVSANAASMGGSQVFLKEGEQMILEDLLKSVVIASANDAAVALAEYVAGSEEAFVERMNARAKELGMKSTHFENTNGLDDTAQNHVLSARDIALMSRELIKHEKILEYSSIWMDTVRDGAFGLTNTNRLVRFYKDATGLKTGSTSKAKFCISATAKRDGMHLICVVMGAETRDSRNAIATKLLDYGFANYELFEAAGQRLPEMRVLGGVENTCAISYGEFAYAVKKGEASRVESTLTMDESIAAPVKKGSVVGKVSYTLDGAEIGSVDIVTTESIDKIGYFGLLFRMIAGIIMK